MRRGRPPSRGATADKPDDHWAYPRLAAFGPYRDAQAAWLKREVASDAFRQAPHRVALIHIPFYFDQADRDGWVCKPFRDLALPVLEDAGITLALSGHTHQPGHVKAGSFPRQPFDIIVGGGPKAENSTLGILDADADALRYTMKTVGGELLASFEARST